MRSESSSLSSPSLLTLISTFLGVSLEKGTSAPLMHPFLLKVALKPSMNLGVEMLVGRFSLAFGMVGGAGVLEWKIEVIALEFSDPNKLNGFSVEFLMPFFLVLTDNKNSFFRLKSGDRKLGNLFLECPSLEIVL